MSWFLSLIFLVGLLFVGLVVSHPILKTYKTLDQSTATTQQTSRQLFEHQFNVITVNDTLDTTTVNLNSCRHRAEARYQQVIHESNHHLLTALSHYETLHTQATSNSHLFHHDLHTSDKDGEHNYHYLILNLNASGLGNRMHTIIAGFLYALLTNRILLLIPHDFDLNNFFCQPFVNSNWIFPSGISLNDLPSESRKTLSGSAFYDQELFYLQDLSLQSKYKFLILSDGEQYFIPLLYLHASFRQMLFQWFPSSNPGYHLIHYLFHPRDHIWNMILETYWAIKQQPQTLTIGLQLRNRGNDGEFTCLNVNEWSDNTHVFVASMWDIRGLIDTSPQLSMIFNLQWKITQRYVELKEQHNDQQIAHAIHDIWVLSMMDEIILTPSSTFGYMALLLAGKRVLYPNSPTIPMCTSELNMNNQVKCYRIASYESCYHRPFAYESSIESLLADNTRNNITHETLFDQLFMKCEDHCLISPKQTNMGWKLRTL